MNIINKIIDDIARSMIMDKEDREKLHLIVQLCKSSGVVSIMEFRQLTSLGIPIARILVTLEALVLTSLILLRCDFTYTSVPIVSLAAVAVMMIISKFQERSE